MPVQKKKFHVGQKKKKKKKKKFTWNCLQQTKIFEDFLPVKRPRSNITTSYVMFYGDKYCHLKGLEAILLRHV